MTDDDNPMRRLQGSDARALERLAAVAHTSPGAMGAALMETGLRALRETGTVLDATDADGLASRARTLQGRTRP